MLLCPATAAVLVIRLLGLLLLPVCGLVKIVGHESHHSLCPSRSLTPPSVNCYSKQDKKHGMLKFKSLRWLVGPDRCRAEVMQCALKWSKQKKKVVAEGRSRTRLSSKSLLTFDAVASRPLLISHICISILVCSTSIDSLYQQD
ncbi:hypothetical protein TRIUR3_04466 [Triticum urartu]|uniref:Uncharacterized protein n=1 Tax=Triticum urartu TaxID=4572 RepID=M8AGU0_TRIUA|nr:hypothetical protein TRIUR3_04466 [Triticum urartu]